MKYLYWILEGEDVTQHYSDTKPENYYRLFELGEDGNYWEIFN